MTAFPGSPRLLKGGIALIDPQTSAIKRVIALQYNPDTLTRTLKAVSTGAEGGDRSEPLRLKGPPVETIKLDVEIDAADQLEFADDQTAKTGIFPQLAALETLLYPTSAQLTSNNLLPPGTMEIIPMEMPLTLFIWSKNRVLPVKLTDFSVTELAFDVNLNPTLAKVGLGFRVLSVDDVGFGHKAGGLFLAYLHQKEQLAAQNRGGTLGALGLGGML